MKTILTFTLILTMLFPASIFACPNEGCVDRESINWEEFIEKFEETQDIELNPFLCVACFAGIYMLVTGSLGKLGPEFVYLLMHMIIPALCYGCISGFELPKPPGQIMSISPNQGEQGTTLTDIQLTCIYTTFEDYGVSAIQFHPKDGLTVSNINVISNTEIEFDLEIAIDAPIGTKGISVVFDNGIDYLYNSEVVFEILEKTN